jgi:hypothetical protein
MLRHTSGLLFTAHFMAEYMHRIIRRKYTNVIYKYREEKPRGARRIMR